MATPTFRPAEDGVLRVATALPAPGFWDGSDAATVSGGYEWALAVELAERFELELEVLDVPFARLDAGDLGGADLALAQIAVTPERARLVEFSTGYFDSAIGVLTATGRSIPDLKAARDLRWVVVEGSIQQDFLAEIVRPVEPALVVDDESDAAAAVAAGSGDAALADLATALVIAGESAELEVAAQFVTRQQYGIALPADGDTAAGNRDAVNTALRALLADGTLDDLADEWLEPRFERNPERVPVIIARTPRSSP